MVIRKKFLHVLCLLLPIIASACGAGGPGAISDDLKALISTNDNPNILEQQFSAPPHRQFGSLILVDDAFAALVDPDLAEGVTIRRYAGGAMYINPNYNTIVQDSGSAELADATLAVVLSRYSVSGVPSITVRAEALDCMVCKYHYDLSAMTREKMEQNPLDALPTLTAEGG